MLNSNTALDIAAIGYVAYQRFFMSEVPGLPTNPVGWLGEYISVLSGLVISVWVVSRMWERFRARGESNKAKLVEDNVRIKHLEDIIAEYKLDLVSRRAKVSDEIHELQWARNAMQERIAALETVVSTNADRLTRLNTNVRPWLKVFQADGTRSLKKAYGIPLDTEEDATTDGE